MIIRSVFDTGGGMSIDMVLSHKEISALVKNVNSEEISEIRENIMSAVTSAAKAINIGRDITSYRY